jgi:hypothetical protein
MTRKKDASLKRRLFSWAEEGVMEEIQVTAG